VRRFVGTRRTCGELLPAHGTGRATAADGGGAPDGKGSRHRMRYSTMEPPLSGEIVPRWGSAEEILAEIEQEDDAMLAAKADGESMARRLTAEELDEAIEAQLVAECAAAIEFDRKVTGDDVSVFSGRQSSCDEGDDAPVASDVEQEAEGQMAGGAGEEVPMTKGGSIRRLWKRSTLAATGAARFRLRGLAAALRETVVDTMVATGSRSSTPFGSPRAGEASPLSKGRPFIPRQCLGGIIPGGGEKSPSSPKSRAAPCIATSACPCPCIATSPCPGRAEGDAGEDKSMQKLKVVCDASVTLTRLQARIAATKRALLAMSPTSPPTPN